MAERIVVEGLDLYYVEPRWQFLRVRTNVGLEGWSEAVLESKVRAVRGVIESFEEYLVGEDPRRITHHWTRLYTDSFYRGGPVLTSAVSAIDIALWDLKGKLLGVPIYELLGGATREQVDVYSHAGGATPEDLIADAQAALSEGFRFVKTGLGTPPPRLPTKQFLDHEIERFSRLREAIGPTADFAIDFHGVTTPAVARVLVRELEPTRPLFIEEPCLPENDRAMREIRDATTIPIATGERLFTRWGFREAIERRIADIYQPDVCHAGGISELVRIAAAADAHYAQIAPHNPLGPIALAASLQVDCACENVVAQEMIRTFPPGLVRQTFQVHDGAIAAPQAPGLGIEIDVEAVQEAANDGSWRHPRLVYPDGSVAPW